MDAIFALDVAHMLMGLPAGFEVVMGATIIHAIKVAILKNGDISRCVALPRLVEGENDLPWRRRMQSQPHLLHPLNEPIVHEQFPP